MFKTNKKAIWSDAYTQINKLYNFYRANENTKCSTYLLNRHGRPIKYYNINILRAGHSSRVSLTQFK